MRMRMLSLLVLALALPALPASAAPTPNPLVAAAPRDPCAPRAKVTIDNPVNAILVGQSYTFTASGNPGGGVFTWDVVLGGNKVNPQNGVGPTFTITGIAPSDRPEDVHVRVTYMGVEDRCALTVVRVRLQSVAFGGTGGYAVLQDSSGAAYNSPHWLDADLDGNARNQTGDRRFPVLYERGARVTINSIVAVVEPAAFARQRVPVLGTDQDGRRFTGTGAISNGRLRVNGPMVANQALPNSVEFFNTYDVRWEASLVTNVFGRVGLSENRMYVSLARPASSSTYESVCELACDSARGAATAQRAADLMWQKLRTLDVRRKAIDGYNRTDGVRMGYWRPPNRVCQSLPLMLRSPIGDGSCVAFAQLMLQMTRIHGIGNAQSHLMELRADPKVNPLADGFLVKDWTFTSGGFVHTGANGVNESDRKPDDVEIVPKGNGFPFTICIGPGADGKLDTVPAGDDLVFGDVIITGPDGICDTVADPRDVQVIPLNRGQARMPCILAGANNRIDSTVNPDDGRTNGAPGTNRYPFIVNTTVVNLPGVAGQDNPEPPPLFFNHFILELFGQLYDPSYCSGPFASQNAHENGSIDGITAPRNASAPHYYAKRNDRAKQELFYVQR